MNKTLETPGVYWWGRDRGTLYLHRYGAPYLFGHTLVCPVEEGPRGRRFYIARVADLTKATRRDMMAWGEKRQDPDAWAAAQEETP